VVVQLVTAVTESALPLPDLGELPLEEFPVEVPKGGTTTMGRLVGLVGERDRNHLVSNADGNEALELPTSTKLCKSSTHA